VAEPRDESSSLEFGRGLFRAMTPSPTHPATEMIITATTMNMTISEILPSEPTPTADDPRHPQSDPGNDGETYERGSDSRALPGDNQPNAQYQ